MDGKMCGFENLEDGLVRDLRDYIIPTIEITLDEDNPSALDEIINLFVNINSTGNQLDDSTLLRPCPNTPYWKAYLA